MADTIPEPVFPEIPATDPTVVPPVEGATYDQWFLTGTNIARRDGDVYDLESFWVKGNATALSNIATNNVLRAFTDMASLTAQLGAEFLEANPDVVEIMPRFLEVLAKVATRQGVL
jgi:hypothetical protein